MLSLAVAMGCRRSGRYEKPQGSRDLGAVSGSVDDDGDMAYSRRYPCWAEAEEKGRRGRAAATAFRGSWGGKSARGPPQPSFLKYPPSPAPAAPGLCRAVALCLAGRSPGPTHPAEMADPRLPGTLARLRHFAGFRASPGMQTL